MPEESTARGSIVDVLRRIEHDAVEGGIPPGARHRIFARLQQEADRRAAAPTRRWLPALTFAAGAALVMAVVGSGVREPASTPRTIGSWLVEGADCREATEGPDTVLAGHCRLVSDVMVVETWDDARLHDGPAGLRVLEGTALFTVEKVPAGAPPVRVEVSHGAIEVLGTRFSVEQAEGGGHVDLFEGRIRFVGAGEVSEVRPGQRLGWGAEAEVVETVEHAGPAMDAALDDARAASPADGAKPIERTRERAPGGPRDAARIIERVHALRAQGRYRSAADVLRRALRRPWDLRTAEVLSYELGRILDRQLHDAEAACTHWRRHAQRFAGGRYAEAVERARAHSCD